MQLLQFVTGIVGSSYSYTCAVSAENKYALVFMHVYAIGLIYLFYLMFQEKYKSGKGAKKSK